MKGFLLFAAGAAVGTVTGAVLVRKKAMADAQQEIEEVREYYRNKKQENKKVEEPKEEKMIEEPKEEEEEEEKGEYEEITRRYVNYNKPEKEEVPQQYLQAEDEPYIIDPEEYGSLEAEGWDVTTLTYFADKVLIDDVDDVIEDVDTIVGIDNLKLFDENPDIMSMYIRNETWRTDFEILRDDWKWSDLREPDMTSSKEKKPHQL